MWLLIFQRDFSNSMGKKAPNLRLAGVNPCQRQQSHWRMCYVGRRTVALFSHIHLSPRHLQWGTRLRRGVAAANSNTDNPLPLPLIFFWGSSASWSQSSTLPKPQNQFGGFSKACLCSESQWRDGMSFIIFPSHATCGVPCPHSKIWCWYHIQLVTSNMHFHPYTSLVPPSVQRVKTGSCSRRRLESI